jgi:hypothetical protein
MHVETAWQEWMYGVDGNKPVKDFTAEERQQQKGTYYNRLPLWQLMTSLVRAKKEPSWVINKINELYGPVHSIRLVAKRIKDDVKNDTLHPDLKVGKPIRIIEKKKPNVKNDTQHADLVVEAKEVSLSV